jgi:hypothetical protein
MTTETLEVVEEFFDLKDPLIISNNIEKQDDLQISTAVGQGTLNGSVTIVFESNNTQNYLLPYASGLKIAGKFTKADGSTAITQVDCEPEHNWGWVMFKQAWLDLGGVTVERIDDVRNATALLGHCLKSKTYTDAYGELDTWILDKGVNIADPTNNTNTGWTRRTKIYWNTYGTFEIYLQLKDLLGFCDVHKLLYLIPIRLTLVRSDNECLLYHNNPAPADNSKVIITDIKWLIPTITPSNERKTAINKILSSNDFIPFTFLKRSTYYIKYNAGVGGTWIIKTTSSNPRYFIIGFKNTATSESNYVTNNSAYNNVGVSEIQINLNGNYYPIVPMKTSFSTNQVVDGYKAYVKFCLKNGVEPPLSMYEWINFYTIYVVDTSALAESMKTNSILIQIEVKRDSSTTVSPLTTGYCLLLEDEINKGFKVGEGRFLEWR